MEVYHTTDKVYQKGQVVCVSDFEDGLSLYHVNVGNNQCVNDYLDKDRPCEFPERKRAIYTFRLIKHCLIFGRKKHIYKADIPETIGHPMCLTEAFTSDSNEPNNIKRLIRGEYWTPKRDWKFYEYLSTSMTIIEECKGPFGKAFTDQNDYYDDHDYFRKYYIRDLKKAQLKLCQSSNPLYLTSLDDTI